MAAGLACLLPDETPGLPRVMGNVECCCERSNNVPFVVTDDEANQMSSDAGLVLQLPVSRPTSPDRQHSAPSANQHNWQPPASPTLADTQTLSYDRDQQPTSTAQLEPPAHGEQGSGWLGSEIQTRIQTTAAAAAEDSQRPLERGQAQQGLGCSRPYAHELQSQLDDLVESYRELITRGKLHGDGLQVFVVSLDSKRTNQLGTVRLVGSPYGNILDRRASLALQVVLDSEQSPTQERGFQKFRIRVGYEDSPALKEYHSLSAVWGPKHCCCSVWAASGEIVASLQVSCHGPLSCPDLPTDSKTKARVACDCCCSLMTKQNFYYS